MSAVEDILNALPLNELADQLGTDPATLTQAAGPAITSILGGLTQNAQTADGEQSLFGALANHSSSALGDSTVNLADIDVAEGQKIVGHVFGEQADGVIQTLGAGTGAGSGLVQKLLPILAPIVLGYLAKNLAGGKYGDLVGSVLGGGGSSGAGGGFGDLIGSVLGGNSGAGSNVLGQILGQVLGGGGSDAAAANNPFQPSQQSGGMQMDPGTSGQAAGTDILGSVLGSIFGHK
ncbi:MAG TPA: DUF937 domain-containing protein [Propionibacteriaceae bacterium]|nr:DUF937 domain-containing protein [Propionibacteriaceae bacterium]